MKTTRYFLAFIGSIFVFLGASAIYGQCPGGVCPTQNSPSWLPQQPAVSVQPAARERAYPSMVVTEYHNGPEKYCGSGVVVWHNGTISHVLTCAHGYQSGMRAAVITQDRRMFWANILGMDPMQDVALLETAELGVDPMPIAKVAPQPGERVYAAGFDGADLTRFTGSWGVLKSYGSYDQQHAIVAQTTCSMKPGTSGGPIVDSHGRLIGTIHGGTGPGYTSGPCLQLVRGLLKFLLPPYRRNPVIVQQQLASINVHSATPDPCTPANGSNVTSEDSSGSNNVASDDVAARLDRIESILETLQKQPVVPGPVGPPGPAGPQGPTGPAGPAGKDADPAPVDLANLAVEVVKRLPPIHVEVIRDGRVTQSEDVFLGGTLPLRLVPVPVSSPKGK